MRKAVSVPVNGYRPQDIGGTDAALSDGVCEGATGKRRPRDRADAKVEGAGLITTACTGEGRAIPRAWESSRALPHGI